MGLHHTSGAGQARHLPRNQERKDNEHVHQAAHLQDENDRRNEGLDGQGGRTGHEKGDEGEAKHDERSTIRNENKTGEPFTQLGCLLVRVGQDQA